MKKFMIACLAMLFLTVSVAPTEASTIASKKQTITVSTVIEVLRTNAPEKLTKEIVNGKNKLPLFIWVRDVEEWTNQLINFSHPLTIREKEKSLLIQELQQYYSEKQATRLFNAYFKKEPNGTYSFKEQESFGSLSLIQYGLQINWKEVDCKYHVEVKGKFSDSLEEILEMEASEKITILKDKLLIDSVESVKS